MSDGVQGQWSRGGSSTVKWHDFQEERFANLFCGIVLNGEVCMPVLLVGMQSDLFYKLVLLVGFQEDEIYYHVLLVGFATG